MIMKKILLIIAVSLLSIQSLISQCTNLEDRQYSLFVQNNDWTEIIESLDPDNTWVSFWEKWNGIEYPASALYEHQGSGWQCWLTTTIDDHVSAINVMTMRIDDGVCQESILENLKELYLREREFIRHMSRPGGRAIRPSRLARYDEALETLNHCRQRNDLIIAVLRILKYKYGVFVGKLWDFKFDEGYDQVEADYGRYLLGLQTILSQNFGDNNPFEGHILKNWSAIPVQSRDKIVEKLNHDSYLNSIEKTLSDKIPFNIDHYIVSEDTTYTQFMNDGELVYEFFIDSPKEFEIKDNLEGPALISGMFVPSKSPYFDRHVVKTHSGFVPDGTPVENELSPRSEPYYIVVDGQYKRFWLLKPSP